MKNSSTATVFLFYKISNLSQLRLSLSSIKDQRLPRAPPLYFSIYAPRSTSIAPREIRQRGSLIFASSGVLSYRQKPAQHERECPVSDITVGTDAPVSTLGAADGGLISRRRTEQVLGRSVDANETRNKGLVDFYVPPI